MTCTKLLSHCESIFDSYAEPWLEQQIPPITLYNPEKERLQVQNYYDDLRLAKLK